MTETEKINELEERLRRLEETLAKAVRVASMSPKGKFFLTLIGVK
jgi:hypothetical protein